MSEVHTVVESPRRKLRREIEEDQLRKNLQEAAGVGATALVEHVPQAVTPMDMLDRAVASGASMEVLERLMALQERWESNQARKAFSEAIAKAKAELKPIVKNRTGHNTKYADMAAIAEAIDPIITKFGLSYRHRAAQSERISVTCIVEHTLGHAEETTISASADKTGSKNDIQAIGSTLTYLQRYTLMLAFGLAAASDDDGRAAGNAHGIISEAQLAELRQLIVKAGANIARICAKGEVEKLEDFPASKFAKAKAALEAAIRDKKNATG